MTHPKTHLPLRATVPAAALAALLLAGCSATHVGDAWQCPLPKGGACGSVAEADPAVPDTRAGDPAATRNTVLGEPLWRPYAERTPGAPPGAAGSCEAGCGGGFDPFAWLARLFADGSRDGETQPSEAASGTAGVDSAPADPAVRSEERAAESVGADLPAEPAPVRDEPAPEDPASDDLRTDEVVARIWIAPFVDADGVYREASHVRVVLEPAGWRVE